ncbi:DUF1353 domain-containing protein [Pararhizobium sp. PWRC1-1]|uniref:DUF1353 domain-containing protein n=1 Tax=Pararhizobium sp. PWRC1-1 TaxID=2804566 RepID=UPI003CFB92E3
MKTFSLASTLLLSVLASSSTSWAFPQCEKPEDRGCFTGRFNLTDVPGDADHKKLADDFGFVDPQGVGWEASSGDVTNGADIPALLQAIIGGPWDDDYLRAAVIHDHYCVRQVRKWSDTHRVFYDAMVAGDIDETKAKLMYYAVYTFGPMWGWTLSGAKCKTTPYCIAEKDKAPTRVSIPGRLDDLSKLSELQAIRARIEASERAGADLSAEDLVRISDEQHPKQPLLQTLPLEQQLKYGFQ